MADTKNIFITGAAKGIGLACLQRLSENDSFYIYSTHNSTPAPKNLLEKNNINFLKADLSNPTDILQQLDGLKIDILINNAGFYQKKSFLELSNDDLNYMFSINFFSPLKIIQKVLPNMIKNKYGKIINISSIAALRGGVNQPHYAASKASLVNLTKSLALLYSRYGINSNCICPGLIKTDMVEEELRNLDETSIKNLIPAGRVGETSEVASLVEFLCSESASYINGQVININGGQI